MDQTTGHWPVWKSGPSARDGWAAGRLAIGSWIGWDRNSITVLFTTYRRLMGCYFIFYLLLLNKSCIFLRSVRFAMHIAR